MRTIRGKLIPETLDELVEPATTALLLVESQRYWASPGPRADDPAYGRLPEMVAALEVLVDACARSGALVVHAPRIAAPQTLPLVPAAHLTVPTCTPSAFVHTNLVSVLRAHRIATVIVAGVSTSGSVCTTAGDVLYHDFYPVVLADCVADGDATLHGAALTVMDSRYPVVSSTDVLAAWSAAT